MVTASFAGVATLAISDARTTLLTDGFFTRPPIAAVALGRIGPNARAIADGLAAMGVDHAAAVIVTHSHYDHALDAAETARRTGAMLVGSESTAMIGRGAGLPSDRIVVADPGQPLQFGAFTVTCVPTEHSPKPAWPGPITNPLQAPARASSYKMGECLLVHVSHTDESGRIRRMIVQASAGFRPGSLLEYPAEVAFLGVPTLGKQPSDYIEAYWRETVTLPGVRRVLPIHWDDFTRSARPEERLLPMPYLADDLDAVRDFLHRKRESDQVNFAFPPRWTRFDPFAG